MMMMMLMLMKSFWILAEHCSDQCGWRDRWEMDVFAAAVAVAVLMPMTVVAMVVVTIDDDNWRHGEPPGTDSVYRGDPWPTR